MKLYIIWIIVLWKGASTSTIDWMELDNILIEWDFDVDSWGLWKCGRENTPIARLQPGLLPRLTLDPNNSLIARL